MNVKVERIDYCQRVFQIDYFQMKGKLVNVHFRIQITFSKLMETLKDGDFFQLRLI